MMTECKLLKYSILSQNNSKKYEKGLIIKGTSLLYFVSIVTETDIPTRRSFLELFWIFSLIIDEPIAILTGTLWTTFTQFPEEFLGGKIENSEPVAGLILSTFAFQLLFG